MSIREILRGLTPPALTEFYRRARGDFRSTWEGVYKHYRDVPASLGGYESDDVVNAMAKYTRALKETLSVGREPEENCGGDNLLLPLLAGVTAAPGRPVKILDFGGGMGEGYLRLKAAVPGPVEYHIIELERTCAYGRRLFEGTSDIFFHNALPHGLEKVDIVYVNSALQYIEDYTGLLGRLSDYRPKHILLVRLSVVEIPTFASMQKYLKEKRLPHWFFSSREIIQFLAAKEYRLVYKKPAARRYAQDKLPQEHRLPGGRMCNLLFSHADSEKKDI